MSKTTPLRQMRKARTLTQVDLARLAGVSQQALSKFETGRLMPSGDLQARIAAILGTSTETLWPTREEARAAS